jgi:hypothetical protein
MSQNNFSIYPHCRKSSQYSMALNNISKFNWEKLLSKVDSNDVRRTLNFLRGKSNEIVSNAAKFGEVEKIDFSAYKKKLRFTGSAVDTLEKAYQQRQLPSFHATLPAFEAQKRQAAVAVVDRIVAAAKDDLVSLTKQLEEFESTKITRETTFADVSDRFPDIAREVEKEIKNHEWHSSPK